MYSQNTTFPRIQPDPKALEYYRLGEKGGYSWTELAAISLWASGDTSTANMEKIRAAAETIKNAADGDSVLDAVDQARISGKIPEKRVVELITFVVQKTASSISASPAGNWRTAIQYIEASISRFGSNRELEQSLNTYRSNLATDYHNRFASEWNKKNYAEAERILNEGLVEFPNNRQLLSDKQTIARQNR